MNDPAGNKRIDQLMDGSGPTGLGEVFDDGSSIAPTLDSNFSRAAPDRLTAPRVPGYRVVAPLGRGATGTVWQAHDLALDREVAIKLLPIPPGEDQAAVSRVLREARGAGGLDHPNVVTLYHVSREAEQMCIVMELLPGGSLAQRIERHGPLPWREATRAIREAAEGLGAAHAAGLVHRDVKPSNLLRHASGRVKVADFGVVRAGGLETRLTAPGAVIGTPAYMAPEQCRGEEADARADIYGLGCTYYHLLTGRAPFAGDSAAAMMYLHCHEPFPDAAKYGKEIPRGVTALLEKMTHKSPARRYASTADLVADLDRLLAAEPAACAGWTTPAERGLKRRAVASAVAVALIAAAGAGSWRLWRSSQGGISPGAQPSHAALPAPLVLRGHQFPVIQVGASSDGQFIWSLGQDPAERHHAELRRWQMTSGGPAGQIASGNQIAFSGAGEVVLLGSSEGGSVQRIDAESPFLRWPGWTIPCAVSRDGRLFASKENRTGQFVLFVRTLPKGADAFALDHSQEAGTGAFSPDGRYLAFDDANGSRIRVWETASGREAWRERFERQSGGVYCFSSDSSCVLRWSDYEADRDTARLYRTATGRSLSLIQAGAPLTAAAVASKGQFVLTASVDREHPLRMWDVDRDQEITNFAPPLPSPECVAISPDDSRALAGCADGTLYLLALPGGGEITRFTGHHGGVSACAFSADGRAVICGGADKTVRVWSAP